MNTLILKLGATGDVVRTSSLLRRLDGQVTWITSHKNVVLLRHLQGTVRCFEWEMRNQTLDRDYDLVINLEDNEETGQFLKKVISRRVFGAYLENDGKMTYSEDSRRWFDLSLISVLGRAQADRLKLRNRLTYQQLIFEGLGFVFRGEPYILPSPEATELRGDVALATEAGPVWPMKKWAYYDELKHRLERDGLVVNVLPQRSSMLEHLADVSQHRCVVAGDSLPMHLALGSNTPCVSIFTCTSPWEIFDYGLLTKVVSPCLEEYFYKRTWDERATRTVSVEEVYGAVMARLNEIVRI